MANNIICEIDTKKLLKNPLQLLVCVIILSVVIFIGYMVITAMTKKHYKYPENFTDPLPVDLNQHSNISATSFAKITGNVYDSDFLLTGNVQFGSLDDGKMLNVASSNLNIYSKNINGTNLDLDGYINTIIDKRLAFMEPKFTELTKISSKVSDLSTKVSDLSTKVSTIGPTVNDLSTKVSTIDTHVSTLIETTTTTNGATTTTNGATVTNIANINIPNYTIIAWYPYDTNPSIDLTLKQVNPKTGKYTDAISVETKFLDPGWVICNGLPYVDNNFKTKTPPDLSNKFIMGSNMLSNTAIINENCNGVKCEVTLKTENLPNHSHVLPLTYGKRTGTGGCPSGGIGTNCYLGRGVIYSDTTLLTDTTLGKSNLSILNNNNLLSSAYSYAYDDNTAISFNNNVSSSTTTSATSQTKTKNSNKPIDILPSHYKMIYIMKVPIS